MFAAVRRSLSFLTRRQRIIYFSLVVVRALTAILDVIGVALVGLVAAFAASQIPADGRVLPASVLGIRLPELTTDNLFLLVLLVLGVFLVKAVIAIALTRALAFFIAGVEVQNSQKIVEHLLGGSLETVKGYSKSEFQYAVTGSANAAFTGVLNNVATIFSEGFLLLALSAAFVVVNPIAALSTLIYFAVIVLMIQFFIGRRLRLAGNDAADGTVETNNVLSDTLDSFREVFVLRRQRFFVTKVIASRLKLARSGATYAFLSGMPRYVIETSLILGVVAFAGVQLLSGSLSEGLVTLGVFLTGGVRIMASLLPLQTAVAAIKITSEQSKLAHSLLASASKPGAVTVSDSEPDADARAAAGAVPLVLDGVGFRYATSKSDVLIDVGMNVAAGTYVALIGPSGAGKTTLVDLILGLVEPGEGTVSIAGERPDVLRERLPGIISYVPQKPGMVSGSIADNIALGIAPEQVDHTLLNAVIDQAYLREFIESLPDGIDTSVGKQVDSLSGGQIQRIGLARALYSRPRLLILDEATSGLDAGSEAYIVKTLRDLHGSVTVLVIAHRLSAVQHADNVYVMEKGRITGSGDFDTLRSTVPMVEEYVQLMSFKDRQAS
jgi:ABC-type multidrug transport system fused ATPase/permease subunit